MDEQKVKIEDSKCFTCRWGLCMLQENSAYLDTNFPMPGEENLKEILPDPTIGWYEEDSEKEDNTPKKITEIRVCSTCFWSPVGHAKLDSPIINVAIIKECSRYEKRGD